MSKPKLAFIGFGEAASHFAISLIENGLTDINAFSHTSRHVEGVTFLMMLPQQSKIVISLSLPSQQVLL